MYMVGSTPNCVPPIQANMNSLSFAIQPLYVSVTTHGTNHPYTKLKKSEYQGNNFLNVTSIKSFNL